MKTQISSEAVHQLKFSRARRSEGMTLIELLAVVAVILLLLGLLIPALSGVRARGQSAVCQSNMRQLTLGCLHYASDNEGYFPWAGGQDRNYTQDWVWGGQPKADTENKAYWANPPSTFGHHAEAGSIFPYMTGQQPIRPGGKIDETILTIYPVYRCPSTDVVGEAMRVNYSMNDLIDSNAVSPGVKISYVKKLSTKVLLVNEDPRTMHNASLGPMNSAGGVTGNGDAYDGGLLHIMHYGGLNISFMDGHVVRATHTEFMDMQRNVPVYFDPVK